MVRNVYLQGELAERFGQKFSMEASTGAEVLRCIHANRPEFKPFLVQCVDKGVDLNVKYQEKDLDEEGMLSTLKEGDVTISIVPAGSKSGIQKILAAVALTFIILPMLGANAFVGPGGSYMEFLKAGMGTATGKFVTMMSINLALTGIQQLMAPDPAQDENPDNYLFNGANSPTDKTDPVPLLYGELRVPGRLIDFDIINGVHINPSSIVEYGGNISIANTNSKN